MFQLNKINRNNRRFLIIDIMIVELKNHEKLTFYYFKKLNLSAHIS